ncbi:MAG TPA: ABC transporter permease [Lachnospiraceae bacterium]|uniref:carbohydrate ABC transporter permease n=1 Tax=Anaerosporobacter sp. TaxID=1872529 RepID=UPI000EEE5E79|nr:sugar ABC transporter permease [Anaerosporobacter sp.]HAB61972.1 ABC transporter permease [Lachnospiraceae bacterium]
MKKNKTAPKSKKTIAQKRENRYGYAFVMPWILGLFIFTLVPMIFSAILSVCEWDIVTGLKTIKFVGLDNFKRLTVDPDFKKSLIVTFKFCLISIPFYQIISLGIALLLNMRVKFMKTFRLIYFLPSIIPVIASTMIWTQIFGEQGLLNQALKVFGIKGPAWLNNPKTALYALIIMGVWGVGNTMIIYLSGLQGVSVELKEAAAIDGANGFVTFFKIVVPMISPTIFFNVVMAVIGSFQYFTQAFVMTEGGPLKSTLFYNLYLYTTAYKNYEMGYAAALAWVMFALIMVFTLLVIKSSSLWVYYQNDDKI